MTYSKGHQQSRASRKAATYSQKSTAQKKNTRPITRFCFAFLICIRSVPLIPHFLKLTGSFHKVIIYISCQLCLKLRLYFQSLSVTPCPMGLIIHSLQWIPRKEKLPLNNPTKFSPLLISYNYSIILYLPWECYLCVFWFQSLCPLKNWHIIHMPENSPSTGFICFLYLSGLALQLSLTDRNSIFFLPSHISRHWKLLFSGYCWLQLTELLKECRPNECL